MTLFTIPEITSLKQGDLEEKVITILKTICKQFIFVAKLQLKFVLTYKYIQCISLWLTLQVYFICIKVDIQKYPMYFFVAHTVGIVYLYKGRHTKISILYGSHCRYSLFVQRQTYKNIHSLWLTLQVQFICLKVDILKYSLYFFVAHTVCIVYLY